MGEVISQANKRGVVKWFNNQKGYGFITIDDRPDIFVHHSAIQMEGYRTLRQGEEVDFDLAATPKGLQALNVRRANGVAAVPVEEEAFVEPITAAVLL